MFSSVFLMVPLDRDGIIHDLQLGCHPMAESLQKKRCTGLYGIFQGNARNVYHEQHSKNGSITAGAVMFRVLRYGFFKDLLVQIYIHFVACVREFGNISELLGHPFEMVVLLLKIAHLDDAEQIWTLTAALRNGKKILPKRAMSIKCGPYSKPDLI